MTQSKTLKNTQFSDIFGRDNSDLYEYSNPNHSGKNPFYPVNRCIYISNSFFHDCTSDSSGGAVSSESTSVERIFIEETTFETCKTTNLFGGGIFFNNDENGECAIYRTCGFNCSVLCPAEEIPDDEISGGQFACMSVKNDETYKNEINESTITGSKKEESAAPFFFNISWLW